MRGEGRINSLNRMLESALIYAKKFNFAVFPLNWIECGQCSCNKPNCTAQGKHPLVYSGVKSATKNEQQIIEWWTKWPKANIAIACGEISNLFVVDVDIKDTVDGRDTIRQLESQFGLMPTTPTQISGSMGLHYFFKYNDSVTQNAVGFLPGLDIRSNGGYIIAAPSMHITGKRYEWEVSSHIADIPIIEAPNWLLNLIEKRTATKDNKKPSSYWTGIMAGVNQGGRNQAATSLIGYLLRRYVDTALVVEIVDIWNERNKPPLSNDELEKIMISIARKEGLRRKEK